MPPDVRSRFIANAPAFSEEVRDPGAFATDLGALAGCRRPILLTHGDRSAPFYPPVIARLAAVLPRAEVRVFAGAGHIPASTHPAEYLAALAEFAEAADAARAG